MALTWFQTWGMRPQGQKRFLLGWGGGCHAQRLSNRRLRLHAQAQPMGPLTPSAQGLRAKCEVAHGAGRTTAARAPSASAEGQGHVRVMRSNRRSVGGCSGQPPNGVRAAPRRRTAGGRRRGSTRRPCGHGRAMPSPPARSETIARRVHADEADVVPVAASLSEREGGWSISLH
jgi:hypothetical protein